MGASTGRPRSARHALPGLVVPARLDYGLRGLLAVARASGARVKVEQMARELGISQKFLASTLTALGHAGIVESQRGIDGGFRLARAPERITIIEVFDALREVDAARPAPPWRCIASSVRDALRGLTVADLLAARTRPRADEVRA
jgi:Rrf2 family protein